MEAYKSDYKKNEDAVLWELHEIRHKLHEELKLLHSCVFIYTLCPKTDAAAGP